MDRRTFLAAAAAARSAHGAAKIPIAFAGGSHSHAFAKARLCQDSAEFELLGVWEEDPALRQKYAAAGIRLLAADEALGGSARVVAVEGAVKDHFRLALRALENGKHVHVEKPPADTLGGMKQLVDAARKRNLLLQSGYMWRYHPGFDKVIAAVRAGYLGEVYMVRGQINTLIDASRRPEWGMFRGGLMFELGAHLIDALVRLLGVPSKVTPFLRKDSDHRDELRDNTAAVFEYPRAMAIIQSATLQPSSGAYRCFEVLGTNGTAVIRPLEAPVLTIDLAKAAGPYQKGLQTVPLPPYTRYAADFMDLAAAVRGERKLVVSLEQELEIQQTLLTACEML
ncbi:MAG: Gfo/Idh/MocA family protein [Acidobacteriota bacterium]|jgi:predicted dehydrogenase|nr:Gfo/Idh/MocA family oxidoreductase [Bryobacteraceae bacterium CoA2 C42]MCA2964231.1 Gfo/Idh/MocA family oxidoreductase [Acidobacteriaceae bacterium]